MAKQSFAVNMVLILVAYAGLWAACGGGGDEGGPGNGGSGSGGSGGGVAGTGGAVVVPSSCTAPGGCPSGYVCVPNKPPSLITTVDEGCAGQCTPPCSNFGPFADMCVQTCRESCTTQQPAPNSDLTGTCRVDSAGGTGGAPAGIGGAPGGTGGAPGGTGGSAGTQIDWNGTWSAELSYTAKCSFASSAMQMKAQKHTVTLKVSTTADTTKAEVGNNYELEGSKGGSSLTLTGDLPLRSHNDGVASSNSLNSPNEITLKLTSVQSVNMASGTMEGSWEASGGWKCTVADGKIAISK